MPKRNYYVVFHLYYSNDPYLVEVEVILFLVFNFAKRQVYPDRYLSAMGHSISILTYFHVVEGCGDH